MKADISKDSLAKELDTLGNQLKELSLKLHSNTMLAFHEVRAAEWLSQYLEKNGFYFVLLVILIYPLVIRDGPGDYSPILRGCYICSERA